MNNRKNNKLKRLLLDGRLIGCLAILTALTFITLSSVSLTQAVIKDKNSDSVKAVVVESFAETTVDSDGIETVLYYPVVEYTNGSGEIVRAMASNGKKYNEYKKGDELSIKIDKNNPTSFEIVSLRTKYVLPILLILIGIGIGCVGVWSINSYIQNNRLTTTDFDKE